MNTKELECVVVAEDAAKKQEVVRHSRVGVWLMLGDLLLFPGFSEYLRLVDLKSITTGAWTSLQQKTRPTIQHHREIVRHGWAVFVEKIAPAPIIEPFAFLSVVQLCGVIF